MTARDILGLIPARGGSKGIPRKNLAPLAGRPLLAYTCDAARASRHLTRTIVSTDDANIAVAARGLQTEARMRPAALAADDTSMLDVVRHVLRDLAGHEGYVPSFLVLLQPTSPLRRAEHIDAAIELLLSSGADGVVSVVPVPHNFTPGSVMRIERGRLVPFGDQPGPTARQQKPVLYARNGPAVLALRVEGLDRRGLYDGDIRPLPMRAQDSLDIDDDMDLHLAEFWMSRQ